MTEGGGTGGVVLQPSGVLITGDVFFSAALSSRSISLSATLLQSLHVLRRFCALTCLFV